MMRLFYGLLEIGCSFYAMYIGPWSSQPRWPEACFWLLVAIDATLSRKLKD